MKKITAYHPPDWETTDSMLMTDEWDHIRYLISEYLKGCEIENYLESGPLPLILEFEGVMKEKLTNVGFRKEDIEDKRNFKKILEILDNQGIAYQGWQWDKYPPYGLPSGSFTISKDNRLMWVKMDIDAALRTLESISIIKGLLANNGKINKEAVKVYLRTLELTVNLLRAGVVPELAVSEAEKKEKSLATRELKKEVMLCIIDNIFKKNPHRPKTLGEVWNKIGTGYEGIRFIETKKEYVAKTGKDEKGKDIVIIPRDGIKKPFKYAKRSLQHFINKLKKQSSQITQ